MAPKSLAPKPSAQKPGGESSKAGQNQSGHPPLEGIANAPQGQQNEKVPAPVVGGFQDSGKTIKVRGTPNDMPILILKPVAVPAKVHFNAVAMMLERGELDRHHASFVASTGHCTEQVVDKNVRLIDGFFCIRTVSPTITRGNAFGFIIGRGMDDPQLRARGVDILITPPNYQSSHLVSPRHCALYLHPKSGAWMLKPMTQATLLLDGQDVSGGPDIALSKNRSVLQLGPLTYRVEFAVQSLESENLYVKARNHRLRGDGYEIPDTRISGLAFSEPKARWRHQLDSGEFTQAYEDFHPRNGQLVYKKTIDVRDNHSRRSAELELRVMKKFGPFTQYHKIENSQGGHGILPQNIHQTVHIEYLAGTPLRSLGLQDVDSHYRQLIQVAIAQQQLTLLNQMHEEGWYHKRIKPDNIRLYRVDLPPVKVETTLIDLGPALKTWSKITFPKHALPPEGYVQHDLRNIQEEREWQDFADERLDIWMLGHSLAMCFFTDCFRPDNAQGVDPLVGGGLRANDAQEYNRVIRKLLETGDVLASLFCAMLDWDPEKRPSTVIALKHRVFDMLKNQEHPVGINVTSLV